MLLWDFLTSSRKLCYFESGVTAKKLQTVSGSHAQQVLLHNGFQNGCMDELVIFMVASDVLLRIWVHCQAVANRAGTDMFP